jgi:hypothetical protein
MAATMLWSAQGIVIAKYVERGVTNMRGTALREPVVSGSFESPRGRRYVGFLFLLRWSSSFAPTVLLKPLSA